MTSALEAAWRAATDLLAGAPAGRVLDALAPDVRERLVDAAGDPRRAADELRVHAGEALVADALLEQLGGPGVGRADDPAALLLAELPARRRRETTRAIVPGLAGVAATDGALADLYPRSFPARATKRRGGHYTGEDLVELVLDLVGWEGRGALLEPAAGGGAFLLGAWRRSLAAGPGAAAELIGVDAHPYACRAARTALGLERLRRGAAPAPEVVRADALAGPPDAPTERAAAFDVVVGNPPWIRGERLPRGLRELYRGRAADLGAGNVDLAAYFVRRAFDWLKPGGRLGFVVTHGLADARSSAGLRAFLATRTIEAVVGLEWTAPAFAGAAAIPLVLVVRNAPPPPGHRVALAAPRGRLDAGALRWTRVPQAEWLGWGRAQRWALNVRRGPRGLRRRLEGAPRPLVAGYGLAVRTRTSAGSLIGDAAAAARFVAPRPLVDGREVRPWSVRFDGRWIDYRPELISDPKTEAFFGTPKVLLARIALTLQAAVDEGADPGPLFARNTVMVVRAPGTSLDAAPHALAALLNSLPLRVYAFLALRAGVLAGSHRATFYAGVAGDLPVPPALLEDARLRGELEALGRAAAAAAGEGGGRRLVELEAQVDDLVAEACGLGARERARLRARAAREPLRTVLARARTPGRRIAVRDYAAGARYR